MARATNHVLIIGGTGFIGERLVKQVAVTHTTAVVHSAPLQNAAPSPALYYCIDATKKSPTLRTLIAGSDTIVLLSPPAPRLVDYVLASTPQGEGKHLVYASTLLVYRGGEEPQSEIDSLSPVTPYEVQKLAEEKKFFHFAKKAKQTPVTILRLGNVYGTPKNKGVVGRMMHALFTEAPLTIAGDGTQTRDFVYVDDVARIMARLIERQQEKAIEVLNVSTGKGTTLTEALALVESVAGCPVRHVYGPRTTETLSIIGNPLKLRRTLGDWPRTPLAKGLKDMLGHFQRFYQRTLRIV